MSDHDHHHGHGHSHGHHEHNHGGSSKMAELFQFMFGKSHLSAGGEALTETFTKLIWVNEKDIVLDAGSGLGGGALYMARIYGARVVGVDLSESMIEAAEKNRLEEEEGLQHLVKFKQGDITTEHFEPESFSVFYSRDVLHHVPFEGDEREEFFAKVFKWLKPGGRLLITDFNNGDKTLSPEYKAHLDKMGFELKTLSEYEKVLKNVGFENVVVEDRGRQFAELFTKATENLKERKEEFLKQFTEQDYVKMSEGFAAHIKYCTGGDMVWGLFTATKP